MSNTLKFGNGEWYGKEGTILAYNDENNNYKPLPFTFDRDSVATRVNKQGLIETVGADQPRIDYLNDSNGALLLEPSRSNIITNSNSSNLNFTLDNTSMTYNSITSPDGENNGILFKQTGSTASNSAYNFGLTTADGTYTYSIFIKANDSTKFRFYSSNGTALTQDFNPQEMTEGVVSGALNLKFESYGNDWFRVSFTRTLSSASHHRFSIYADRNNTQKSVYIFGLQIESNASYATSYIPTQGSAVTRLADDMPNNLNINPLNIGNSYTLFLDADLNNFENNRVFCEIENSASNGVFTIRNTIGQIRVYNNLDAQYPTGNLQSNTNRWAIRIDGNSYKIFGADNSLSGTLPTARNIGEIKFYGSLTELKINNFNIYNTALSDAECEALVN